MTQDFAKIKPEPLLERKPVATPPAWSLMMTGVIVGVAIGVFACVLFYMSGNVPVLNLNTPVQAAVIENRTAEVAQIESTPVPAELELEFYTELREYEVDVDATPVALGAHERPEVLSSAYMLQTGAFQQQDLANIEMRRQLALGLQVIVKREELLGRTLYLVQSGPYDNSGQLNSAEQLLRSNNIPSMRMALQ